MKKKKIIQKLLGMDVAVSAEDGKTQTMSLAALLAEKPGPMGPAGPQGPKGDPGMTALEILEMLGRAIPSIKGTKAYRMEMSKAFVHQTLGKPVATRLRERVQEVLKQDAEAWDKAGQGRNVKTNEGDQVGTAGHEHFTVVDDPSVPQSAADEQRDRKSRDVEEYIEQLKKYLDTLPTPEWPSNRLDAVRTVTGFDHKMIEEKCGQLAKQLQRLYVIIGSLEGSQKSDAFEAVKSLEDGVCVMPVYCGGTRLTTLLTTRHQPTTAKFETTDENEPCPARREGGGHQFDDKGNCVHCRTHLSCTPTTEPMPTPEEAKIDEEAFLRR